MIASESSRRPVDYGAPKRCSVFAGVWSSAHKYVIDWSMSSTNDVDVGIGRAVVGGLWVEDYFLFSSVQTGRM